MITKQISDTSQEQDSLLAHRLSFHVIPHNNSVKWRKWTSRMKIKIVFVGSALANKANICLILVTY